jgi:hypothetical protein
MYCRIALQNSLLRVSDSKFEIRKIEKSKNPEEQAVAAEVKDVEFLLWKITPALTAESAPLD